MRLTKYGNTSHENGVCCTHFNSKECHEVAGNCAYGCKWEEAAWSKLAEYEELEEQGLLLKLPCREGTKVWTIMCGMTGKHPTLFRQEFEVSMLRYWGKAVFLTKAEAEAALERMGE